MNTTEKNIETIWTEYQSRLRAFVHSRVSNPADVEDLQQDILIKTYTKLHTLSSDESVRSWIMQVANRSIIDFYRKRRNKNKALAETIFEAEKLIQDEETDSGLARCIAPFIAALPEDSATLINVIEIEGLSQKRYAKQLGISYSTLKSRVQKARRELRAVIQRCCDLSFDRNGKVIAYQAKRDTSCKDCAPNGPPASGKKPPGKTC